ncbi:MAG TPA: hypothetical protein VGC51_09900 [Hansschlegelia sp.]
MRDDESAGAPPGPDPRSRGPSLREALRRARLEAAERADVVIDLRQAELARLEILRDVLAPVFAETPPDVDMFDVGVTAGERPRLFIDMVAFIEMGHDRRLYRFLRDGRNGRSLLAESEQVQPIVDAVTTYVAHRLVERERLLADEDRGGREPPSAIVARRAAARTGMATDDVEAAAPPQDAARRYPCWARLLAVLFAFGVGGGVGAVMVFALMRAAAKGLLPGVG